MLRSLAGRVKSALEPRPHNAECPVTGDTFYYEKHRTCPYCGWRLWVDGSPGASHRRAKEEDDGRD